MLPTSFTHFEALDSLPYIDHSITPQELRRVEQLVQNEVAHINTDEMHPAPLGERNDGGSISSEQHTQGIDMSRYTDFHDDHDNDDDNDSDNGEHVNHDRMYTSLAYSVLRERNASIALQNEESISSIRNAHLESLSKMELSYRDQLTKKRQRVEEINMERKRRQLDFMPTNELQEQTWQEGVNSMVDMGLHKSSEK
ncbi:hypothetical protein SBP28_001968 [Candidozyma auris]|nr:hypothetical protein CJJ09_002034 [[Candida] auris]